LQRHLDLPEDPAQMLFMHSGRLLERRGSDLLLELVPELRRLNAQLVVMGHGDRGLEQAWSGLARHYPNRVATVIGDDEHLLHLMVAAADVVITPSRFEPCGLDQLHGMRYGTVPVVHMTGGLADSVIDFGPDRVPAADATGFGFEGTLAAPMIEAIERATGVYRNAPQDWQWLVGNGMRRDFSWTKSAQRYEAQYLEAIQHSREFGGG
jgi:starch synthase